MVVNDILVCGGPCDGNRVCLRTRLSCHYEEFPWACGPPEAINISVVPAKAGTHCRSNGFPLARE
jgi:hypothetical protein